MHEGATHVHEGAFGSRVARVSWNLSYGRWEQNSGSTWAVGTELRFSTRAASALTH